MRSPDPLIIEKNTLQIKVLRLVYTILLLILFVLAIKFASYIKEICFSFAMALLINYLLSKPVDFLTKYIRLRFVSVLIIYAVFLTGISFFVAYLIPKLIDQVLALKEALPMLVANFDLFLVKLHEFFIRYQIEIPVEGINRAELLNNLLALIPKIDYNTVGNIASIVLSNSVYIIAYIFLTLILSIYLLVDGSRAWELFLVPFAPRIQFHLHSIKLRADERLNAFILGQFQVATMTASVMLITYLALNVPYALLLGLAQLLEIIPVLGTWLAFIPCLIIVSFTTSLSKGLIALIVYMAYSQIIRDNFIAPRIMGSQLGFHPLAILLSLLLGAQLGAIVGVIMALPVLAVVTSVIDYNMELSALKVSSLA